MSDWQVGDLALCVDDTPHPDLGPSPCKSGCIYTVSGVVDHYEGVGLLLHDVKLKPGAAALNARRFRKIRPSAIEHIEALKRLPVEVKEDA